MRNRKLLNRIMIIISVLIIASMIGSFFFYIATQSTAPTAVPATGMTGIPQ
ncbi:hypothetical protein IPM19_02440 [bacterium]|nr:MAG: hypothetical protein IPM19_02440 [bacterium]